MSYDSFFDFKELAASIETGSFINSNNESVRISDITIRRLEKQKPQKIFYKYCYTDEDFEEIDVVQQRRSSTLTNRPQHLQKFYNTPVGLVGLYCF